MLELLAGLSGLLGGALASEMVSRGVVRFERELTVRLVKHFQDNQDLLRAPRRAHCSACLEILERARASLENATGGYASAGYTGRFGEYLAARRYFEGAIRNCGSEKGFKQQLAAPPAASWALLVGQNRLLVEDALAALSEAGGAAVDVAAPFSDAAAAEIAAAGWPHETDAIVEVLRPICRDEYVQFFARAMAEEIKNDQKFAVLWSVLRLEETRRIAARAARFAEAVHRNLTSGPRLQVPSEADSLFHYTSPIVDTIGRDREKEQLRSFLGAEPAFCWMQLAGVGGQGKSRLALQLVIEAANREWAAGFLYEEELKDFAKTAVDWQPDRPHLIVLDYIVGRETGVSRLMRAFWDNRENYLYPVRLLLLERQRWDAGNAAPSEGVHRVESLPTPPRVRSPIRKAVEELAGAHPRTLAPEAGRGAAEWFVKACGNADVYIRNVLQMAYPRSVIELDRMRDTELVWIVRRVAQLCGHAQLSQTDRFISDQLGRLDNAGRPLFAYLLGLALTTAEEGAAWTDREDLLNYVLRREQKQRWFAYFGGEPPAIGDDIPAMRLAVLATIVRGFDFREEALREFVHPVNSDLRRQALALNAGPIAATEKGPGTFLPQLEPDLVGEWFVLNAFDGGLPMEDVLAFAWRIRPTETGAFLQRLAQDFGEHPVAIRAINCTFGDEVPAALGEFAVQILRTVPPRSAPLDGALVRSVRQLADSGDADAGVAMAIRLMQPAENDLDLRAELLAHVEGAVAKGNGAAMSLHGYLHLMGRFVPADKKRAAQLFEAGAQAGSVSAMRNYAITLMHGVGVDQDSRGAAHWAAEAANREDRDAMHLLGQMHLHGDGVPKDLGEAIRWLLQSADAGHKDAARQLEELRIARILYFGHSLVDGTAREWAISQSARLGESPTFAQSPLLPGRWDVLSSDEAMPFLAEIATSAYDQNLMSELLRLECQALRSTLLGCFADCRLIEVQVRRNLDRNPCSFFALQGPRGAVVLDGTNSSIYQFARHAFAPSGATEVNAYIRFFFGTILGVHGRFYVVDGVDDIPWTEDFRATVEGKEQIDRVLEFVVPLESGACEKLQDGTYRCRTTMLFKDSLFTAHVRVDKHGWVAIHDEQLVIENLNVQFRDYDGIFRYPHDPGATGAVRNYRGRDRKAAEESGPNAEQTAKKVAHARLALGRPSRTANEPAQRWAESQMVGFQGAPWIDGPLVSFDWRDVGDGEPEFRAVLEKTYEALASQLEGNVAAAMRCCALRVADLPFARGVQLAEVQFASGSGQSSSVIAALVIGPFGASILDGQSNTMHAIRSEILRLRRPDDYSAYLRFFNAYVYGNDVPFLIVDRADDIAFVAEDEKTRLAALIRPLRILDDASIQNAVNISATVLYGRDLFLAEFRVESGGMIHMEADEHLSHVSFVKERFFSGPIRWIGERKDGVE